MNTYLTQFSNILFLVFVVGIPLYGAFKKVNVFDAFIEGAKEGFSISVGLIPYLLALMLAVLAEGRQIAGLVRSFVRSVGWFG